MIKIKKPRRLVIIAGLVILVAATAGIFTRMNSSDCTSVEKYDALTGSCYYDCTTDEDCAAKAKAVEEQLNGFFEDSKTKLSAKPTQTAANTPSSSDDTALLTKDFTGSETSGTIYTVAKDLSLKPTPSDGDKELWDLFSRVVGKDDLTRYVQSFEVFDDSGNDSAASVWQSQTPGKWHVNVNAAYRSDKKDLVHTMVHEYGHIVSLNSTQVNGSVPGTCPYLQLSEGCANKSAYINAFYDAYWSKYGEDVPAEDGQNQDEVADFYQQHSTAFVSEYAATNYGEDWAETWAIFVTRAKPTGTQEKDQKVLSLYEHPDLVNIRNRIRIQIASSL